MSKTVKNWTEWLKSSRFSYMSEEQVEQTVRWLFNVRDRIFDKAKIKEGDTVIDIGTGTGLLAFGLLDKYDGKVKVIASDKFEDCLVECERIAVESGVTEGFNTLLSGAEQIKLPDASVDVALMRSVLVHIIDKEAPINEAFRILKPGGRFAFFEPVITSNTQYWQLVNPENVYRYEDFKKAEIEIMSNPNEALTNFNEKSLAKNLQDAGFSDVDMTVGSESSTYVVQESMIEPWFNTPPSPNTKTLKQKFLGYFSEEEVEKYIASVKADLTGREITVKSISVYVVALK